MVVKGERVVRRGCRSGPEKGRGRGEEDFWTAAGGRAEGPVWRSDWPSWRVLRGAGEGGGRRGGWGGWPLRGGRRRAPAAAPGTSGTPGAHTPPWGPAGGSGQSLAAGAPSRTVTVDFRKQQCQHFVYKPTHSYVITLASSKSTSTFYSSPASRPFFTFSNAARGFSVSTSAQLRQLLEDQYTFRNTTSSTYCGILMGIVSGFSSGYVARIRPLTALKRTAYPSEVK